MRFIKKKIKKIFYTLGLELKLVKNPTSAHSQFKGLIKKTKANKLLDIGANTGQFAETILSVDDRINIFCVEPIPAVHSMLHQKFISNTRVVVLPPMAVCRENKSVSLNISKNLVSSSLLAMESLHIEKAPGSEIIENIRVNGVDLDTLFRTNLKNLSSMEHEQREWIVKIDAQGAEFEILLGAESSLKYISAFICELSLRELYSKQVLWLEVISKMSSLDYQPFFIQTGFSDPETAETLQVDVGFIHSSFVKN